MNKKFIDRLFVILIIAVLIFIVFVVYFMQSEATQCLSNPYSYSLSALNGGGVTQCSCIQIANDGLQYKFKFNNTNWWAIETENYLDFMIP